MISFTVYGIPAPKGSTKAFYRPGMKFPVVTEDNKRTRPWAAIVKDAAAQAIPLASEISFPSGIAVGLRVWFHMPRPKSLPKRVSHHTKKPDLDKLVRAIKDSLTGVIWSDDSQVIHIDATKMYTCGNEMPRAEISVEQLSIPDTRELGLRDLGA